MDTEQQGEEPKMLHLDTTNTECTGKWADQCPACQTTRVDLSNREERDQ